MCSMLWCVYNTKAKKEFHHHLLIIAVGKCIIMKEGKETNGNSTAL